MLQNIFLTGKREKKIPFYWQIFSDFMEEMALLSVVRVPAGWKGQYKFTHGSHEDNKREQESLT